ncbi:hypothetical protein [Sphingopyxis sp. GC21]|uniref:hypothetical protein n=1 Tax=Sphingopyxis sp. GC21 TaxID=2933562 RepID=UPI0021E3834C|nr:hypothetical protein [Sphingopyxis sp. GC21]
MKPGMSGYQSDKEVTGGANRRHFVHVYAVIRIKVEVDADNHRTAMEAADKLLFAGGLAVRLTPAAQGILDAEYAAEVAGYLVDEDGDDTFIRSRAYGPDHDPEENKQ